MSRCCWVFLFLALLLVDLNIGRVLFCCFLCHIGQQCGEVIVNLARFCITGRKRRLVVVVGGRKQVGIFVIRLSKHNIITNTWQTGEEG